MIWLVVFMSGALVMAVAIGCAALALWSAETVKEISKEKREETDER